MFERQLKPLKGEEPTFYGQPVITDRGALLQGRAQPVIASSSVEKHRI